MQLIFTFCKLFKHRLTFLFTKCSTVLLEQRLKYKQSKIFAEKGQRATAFLIVDHLF